MPQGPIASALLLIGFSVGGIIAMQDEPPTVENRSRRQVVGPVSVAPTGWRRTESGWELADHWPVAAGHDAQVRINRLIQQQRQSESSTAAATLCSQAVDFIRRLDPITLVCAQISTLALLLWVARRARFESADSTLAE